MTYNREDKVAMAAVGGIGCVVLLWWLLLMAAIVTGIVLAWKNFG